MLYHVPDIPQTLTEITRVLKPGGLLCTATNGLTLMLEIHQFIQMYNHNYQTRGREAARFCLENAQTLSAPYFSNTDVVIYDDHLEVTKSKKLLAYILSIGRMIEGITSQDITKIRRILQKQIMIVGHIYISKSQGLLLAVKEKHIGIKFFYVCSRN